MKLKFTFICVYGLLLAFGPGGLARGEDASGEDLRKQLGQLQAEVARLRAEGVTAEKMAELERRIDLLAAEIERSRTGGATEASPTQGVPGFAPAASKVYRTQKGVSIGGYGEALYENFASLEQDARGLGADRPARLPPRRWCTSATSSATGSCSTRRSSSSTRAPARATRRGRGLGRVGIPGLQALEDRRDSGGQVAVARWAS